jgi:hypothetical protein
MFCCYVVIHSGQCPSNFSPEFSPIKYIHLPTKTLHTTNRGHIAVTFNVATRHIGVFKN